MKASAGGSVTARIAADCGCGARHSAAANLTPSLLHRPTGLIRPPPPGALTASVWRPSGHPAASRHRHGCGDGHCALCGPRRPAPRRAARGRARTAAPWTRIVQVTTRRVTRLQQHPPTEKAPSTTAPPPTCPPSPLPRVLPNLLRGDAARRRGHPRCSLPSAPDREAGEATETEPSSSLPPSCSERRPWNGSSAATRATARARSKLGDRLDRASARARARRSRWPGCRLWPSDRRAHRARGEPDPAPPRPPP